MSDRQNTVNQCYTILPRFQNQWAAGREAGAAFDRAKESAIAKLAKDMEVLQGITFEDMKKRGLVCPDVAQHHTR